MTAISFTSGKGGTGKTTMVLNLGAALADMGNRVVLVDADILTHSLSVLCRFEEEKGLPELFLKRQIPISDVIHRIPGLPNLSVIPSSTSLDLLMKMRRLLNRNKPFVARRMSEISKLSDYVLIDTPAGISREVLFAVSIGDAYCLVTETGPAELEGTLVINMLAEAIGLKSLGVIFNRVRVAPPENLKKLCEESFGRILGIIPFDIRFMEAFEERQIFYIKYPRVAGSKEIKKSAQRIVESLQERQILRETKPRGKIALDNQRIQEIIESYDRILVLNPTDVEAWINKGLALTKLGRYGEAIACFDKAIELAPTNERPRLLKEKAKARQDA